MIRRFVNRRSIYGKVASNRLSMFRFGSQSTSRYPKLSYNFSQIPDDLDSFNQERLRKSEVLKVRNQAKQMMEQRRIQEEELAKRGQISPQEIMKQVDTHFKFLPHYN